MSATLNPAVKTKRVTTRSSESIFRKSIDPMLDFRWAQPQCLENAARCLASIAQDAAFTQHGSGLYPVSRLPLNQRARRTSSTCSPGSLDPPLDVETELLWCVLLPLAGDVPTTQDKKKPRVFEPASSANVRQPVSGGAAAVHLSWSGEDGSRQLESCCGLKRAFLTPAR